MQRYKYLSKITNIFVRNITENINKLRNITHSTQTTYSKEK